VRGLHEVPEEHDSEQGEEPDGEEGRELGNAQEAPRSANVVDIVEDRADDLTEAQGHDGQVVTLESEGREADEETHESGENSADDDSRHEDEHRARKPEEHTCRRRRKFEQQGRDRPRDVGADSGEAHVPQGELARDAVDEVEAGREDDEDQTTVDDDHEVAVQDVH
jgi:hypothetical protein